jgi:hypothetical protein
MRKRSTWTFFIKSFDSDQPSDPTKHFLLKANSAIISEGHFILTDESTPVQVDFKKLNTSITDFLLYGPDVSTYQ